MQRPIYIQRPTDGDYVMRFTGLTWSVLRRTGEEAAFILSTGHRDRKAALLEVQSASERDQSDGWEPVGAEWFRQQRRRQLGRHHGEEPALVASVPPPVALGWRFDVRRRCRRHDRD